MKLLRFLESRINVPKAVLFRWLRTGQIRLNKRRVKAELILSAGDEVRLPPQAAGAVRANVCEQPAEDAGEKINSKIPDLDPGQNKDVFGAGLRLTGVEKHYLVLDKDAGLPVQPGSGHADSVSLRLKKLLAPRAAQAGSIFVPAPAHRLDKQSSGLVLAGRTHIGQRYLHALFSGAGENTEPAGGEWLERGYFVWVSGIWKLEAESLLTDMIFQGMGQDGLERMHTESSTGPVPERGGKAVQAMARYTVAKTLAASPCGPATLLEVSLITGRKHQIRVQCASRGHPVIGDRRYGGPRFPKMLLHAGKICIPGTEDFMGASFTEACHTSFPDWPEPFSV